METQGFDLLDKLLLLVTAGVIAPLAAYLKHKDWVITGIIRPEFVKAALGIAAAFALAQILDYTQLGAEETIERGLQAIGGASVAYGATRYGIKKKTGQ